MNAKFKPLGLAAAVAAATAGYTGVSNAVSVSDDGLGGVGLIPYYTVRDGFVTGVHVTNTSDQTQVVKIRLRRGVDSMDALDFNVIMSPKDVWTGFIQDEGENIVFNTTDTSCTAPAATNDKFVMPDVYREGAEEGYIEIIAMGTPADTDETTSYGDGENSPIAKAAKHTSEGVPLDCAGVRSNFFAFGTDPSGKTRGVEANSVSHQVSAVTTAGSGPTTYAAPGNPLQVSYFLRDSASGLEMGNQAVMIKDFLLEPAITNQQFGLFSGDLLGFDYPDLNGGVPVAGLIPEDATVASVDDRDKFVALRGVIGSDSVINDWSANADLNVGTDWVITFPGQYTMLNLPKYFASILTEDLAAGAEGKVLCERGDGVVGCDNRDIPAIATFDVYDREEQQRVKEDGDLVVSPQIPGEIASTVLPYEVNVVQWGAEPVLGSVNSDIAVAVPESGNPFGWAELTVKSNVKGDLAVCDATSGSANLNLANQENWEDAATNYTCSTTSVDNNEIPKIGFVAWERSFPGNPDANYGRAINHAYRVDAVTSTGG